VAAKLLESMDGIQCYITSGWTNCTLVVMDVQQNAKLWICPLTEPFCTAELPRYESLHWLALESNFLAGKPRRTLLCATLLQKRETLIFNAVR